MGHRLDNNDVCSRSYVSKYINELGVHTLRTTYTQAATILEQTRLETCFGETGLKIQPDVFRHDNCEGIKFN